MSNPRIKLDERAKPNDQVAYRGRFAPSPTGPLHFGSLIAAVGSYLEAKTHGGSWLVRMEDLDPPREMPGAAEVILTTLETFGFEWNGPVLYQSQRLETYDTALQKLEKHGLLYPCACTRKEIADSALHGIDGLVYPGTCGAGLGAGKTARAWRIRVRDQITAFEDAIQGRITQNLAKDIGDFILKRADGCYAYQLAVVVDDAEQAISHVVRGADLLNSTPRQIYLQQCLRLATPVYAHLPIATNQDGEKLSKQTLAKVLDNSQPVQQLWQALDFLGQRPDSGLKNVRLQELWAWAIHNWQIAKIPNVESATMG
jgi:glutamyl-Q tRNA(Asp) synthetase